MSGSKKHTKKPTGMRAVDRENMSHKGDMGVL